MKHIVKQNEEGFSIHIEYNDGDKNTVDEWFMRNLFRHNKLFFYKNEMRKKYKFTIYQDKQLETKSTVWVQLCLKHGNLFFQNKKDAQRFIDEILNPLQIASRLSNGN